MSFAKFLVLQLGIFVAASSLRTDDHWLGLHCRFVDRPAVRWDCAARRRTHASKLAACPAHGMQSVAGTAPNEPLGSHVAQASSGRTPSDWAGTGSGRLPGMSIIMAATIAVQSTALTMAQRP